MKRVVAVLVVIVTIVKVFGQEPEFSYDFEYCHALLNPAYSAKWNFMSFQLTGQLHWIYPQSPRDGNLWLSRKFNKVGVGLQISGYTEGYFRKVMIGMAYNYDVVVSRVMDLHLAMGLEGAWMQDYLDLGKLRTDVPDPLLMEQGVFSRFYPQLAVGIMLYNPDFEFGIAGSRLLPNSGYFFMNYRVVYPPVLIVHGAYFYKEILQRYMFRTEGAAFLSADRIDLIGYESFYWHKYLKLGLGLAGNYYMKNNVLGININALVGVKVITGLYLTYQFSFNDINHVLPMISHLGSGIGIRYDFYPHSDVIPYFY